MPQVVFDDITHFGTGEDQVPLSLDTKHVAAVTSVPLPAVTFADAIGNFENPQALVAAREFFGQLQALQSIKPDQDFVPR